MGTNLKSFRSRRVLLNFRHVVLKVERSLAGRLWAESCGLYAGLDRLDTGTKILNLRLAAQEQDFNWPCLHQKKSVKLLRKLLKLRRNSPSLPWHPLSTLMTLQQNYRKSAKL